MKAGIRREMIARRNSISQEEVAEKSALIQRRVMELPVYKESKAIALYAGFNNEVLTSLLFGDALKEGKRVLFPCIRKERKDLIFVAVEGMDELELGPFGIWAPPYNDGMEDCADEAGLLLIPGVAYDPRGGRVGYGGGFYDRTLQRLVKKPFIMAPAYEFQVLDEVPVLPHDVRVDAIVTEQRVLICKSEGKDCGL